MSISFTLLTDGTSDRALLPIVRWTLRQHVGELVAINGAWADFEKLRKRPSSLVERIEAALNLYPCNIMVIHRDAERESPEARYQEIETAIKDIRLECNCQHICVVPVRMTEAWLLFDESAIRQAAGNPNGAADLKLPRLGECERLPDPKSVLSNALRTACELRGRRLKSFRADAARVRLADLIADYDALRQLEAFSRFEADVQNVLGGMSLIPSDGAV